MTGSQLFRSVPNLPCRNCGKSVWNTSNIAVTPPFSDHASSDEDYLDDVTTWNSVVTGNVRDLHLSHGFAVEHAEAHCLDCGNTWWSRAASAVDAATELRAVRDDPGGMPPEMDDLWVRLDTDQSGMPLRDDEFYGDSLPASALTREVSEEPAPVKTPMAAATKSSACEVFRADGNHVTKVLARRRETAGDTRAAPVRFAFWDATADHTYVGIGTTDADWSAYFKDSPTWCSVGFTGA